LLGDYEEASWSPRGLFVVATRDHELFALEPGGRPRWSLARAGRVRHARWSPDGFRIAYLSGSGVRVVAGDGTGDAALVPNVALTAPAWRPDTRHRLAYADRRGRVAVVDTDTKRTLWRSGPGSVPAELAWSADGARLLVLSSEQVRVLDSRGRSLLTLRMAPGTRAQTVAFAPGGDAFALVSYAEAAERTRLELVRFAEKGAAQRLLSGLGRFGDIAWSPDGQWLLAAWRDADQWVFIHTGAKRRAPIERLRAVANITRQFDPGGGRGAAFPQLDGWCCPP
jgi:WD40 repeat protein